MSHRFITLAAVIGLGLVLSGLFPSSRRGHAVAGVQGVGSVARRSQVTGDLYHWSRLPVRIFIAGYDPHEQDWARIALSGFDEWVRATNGAVNYRVVDSPLDAQITVRFTAAPYVPTRPDLVGLTTTYWDGSVLQSADIVLATGQKSAADLQTAAAHELGHALGIRDHSDDPDDLMYSAPIRGRTPIAHPVTEHDLEILKRCYPRLFTS